MKTLWLICAATLISALLAIGLQSASEQSASSSHSSARQQPIGEPASRARGRVVFHDRCEICHYSDSMAQKIGPGLKDLYSRGKFANGAKTDDASVQRWILNGSKNMPPFQGMLTLAQIKDLTAYLRSI